MANQEQQEEQPLHMRLPPVTFTPMGAPDSQQNQGNLLQAKQSPAFPITSGLVAHCLSRRGERLMMDFTAQGVAVRFEIDGMWMNADPMDRQSGDATLAVLKTITNLNVQDRKSRQDGKFGAEFTNGKFICEFTSQGVKTGERVLVKIHPKKPKFENIEQLGMRDKMRQQLRDHLNEDAGMVLISAPAGGGLTTTWNMALDSSDRLIRDFVSIEDKDNPEDEIINITPNYFDKAGGEAPAELIPKLLLKEPNVFVVPDPTNAESLKSLCERANSEQMVITRAQAKSATEAVLRLLAYKAPPADVGKALTAVLNVRLLRKLCDQCKQPFQPAPQLLQRLGIPAGRVQVLYQEFKPPPPDQQVDEKGRPIEIPVCQTCGGVGYCGRTGIFELLSIDDPMREAITKQPNPDALRRVAKASGHRSLQEEGILLVAQGVTSIPELQRVLKQ
jgi:type II secretory ATPase GspE/PulE/Tfp pilus assembly ATPase PilB-like protein